MNTNSVAGMVEAGVVNLVSAGAGALFGVYTSNHNPFNLPRCDDQIIAGAVSGTAVFVATKALLHAGVKSVSVGCNSLRQRYTAHKNGKAAAAGGKPHTSIQGAVSQP